MTKFERLKKEAKRACSMRNHQIGKFKTHKTFDPKRLIGIAYCDFCGSSVHVDTSPTPNGIDIGGELVAINCNFSIIKKIHNGESND